MDRITKQLVDDFIESQEIKSGNASENFEVFTNYSVVSKEYNRTFDPTEITIGGGNDTGIDGIAIIVNGYLVDDIEEIKDLIEQNNYLDVTYIFTQAKTSSSFETAAINTFLYGIKDFFTEEPRLVRNTDIERYAEISNFILDNAIYFDSNPVVKLFYVTTGKWNDDPNHLAVVSSFIEQMQGENLFEDIIFNPVGAAALARLYRTTKSPNNAEFEFSNKATLPETEGVDEAYYGVLPFSEFKKILVDENDNIRSVFDDNVRDFQGIDNPVNKKINNTLKSGIPEQFVVLNNGVTVVATSLKTSANKFMISDFQIVNGCQTSNVLYQNRNEEGVNNIYIPFRLIVTNKDDVKSQITLATNSQTAIKTEQLAVLSEFQKNLESYYSSTNGEGKLYYERRSKQYNKDKTVVKSKIITVANQIKSFSAMFYENPHLVSSFFGSIAKKTEKKDSEIFNKNHSYAPYYLSGLAYYKLESLFRSGLIDTKYRKIKFHLIMLFRLIAEEEKYPLLHSKKIDAYCEKLIGNLLNQDVCTDIFLTAISIVESSALDVSDKLHIKQSSMVDNLKSSFEEYKANNILA